MTIVLGTSGWQYTSWKTNFYDNAKQAIWLERYAEQFQTVEVNNAFYRLPPRETFEHWRDRTPADFVFAVKVSRYLSHIKRLKDPEEPVQRFLNAAAGLGEKLGPVLLQLPPKFKIDLDRLSQTLRLFPNDMRVTVEFRDDSWFTNETRTLLEKFGVALCLADSPRRNTPVWRTADWGYLRLHEGAANPHPCYSRPSLRNWADRVSELWPESNDVFVYFNNDTNVCAIRDAGVFAEETRNIERTCTRAPNPKDVRVIRA